MDAYMFKIKQELPRFVSMYDADPFSITNGYGDRLFWSWKLIDYNNGSTQGGILSLAVLIQKDILPAAHYVNLIKMIIRATLRQMKKGMLDEAFPHERSFCVSAAVAFDILKAVELLENYFSQSEKEEFLDIAEYLVSSFERNVETHGFISNHLAAGVAAIYQLSSMRKRSEDVAHRMLESILARQSSEGWYLEYQGADPGYQTLTTYYLASIYSLKRQKRLLASLKKSIEWLSYFVHPDGSLGGEYGSRNTEIYYPAGFEILAESIPLAGAIADYLHESIAHDLTMTLSSVDAPNFIPFMNNYAMASLMRKKRSQRDVLLPFEQRPFTKHFSHMGASVVNKKEYYLIISYRKGGVTKIYDKRSHQLIYDDGGYMGVLGNKRISTQRFVPLLKPQIGPNTITFTTSFWSVIEQTLTPPKMLLLRLLTATIMRLRWCKHIIMKLLARKLITSVKRQQVQLERKITFDTKQIDIQDTITNSTGRPFTSLSHGGKFSTIHMASSKYYLPKMVPASTAYVAVADDVLREQVIRLKTSVKL